MTNVFTTYLDLRIRFDSDIARYIVENYVKRKNIKAVEKCCRLYNHYTDIIKFDRILNYSQTIKIQIRLQNITLIFHNIIFPIREKKYRVDAIIHKKNVNIYIINFKSDLDGSPSDAVKIVTDIKSGIFNDYPLMHALSKQIL